MEWAAPCTRRVSAQDVRDGDHLAAERAVAEFVSSRINFERMPTEQYGLRDFKLDRMRSLLRRLGDPQNGRPAVHIAGTKGKGSTAAMIASILQAAGHRVGLFTSPHIEHYGERMLVNGQRPTAAEFVSILDVLRPAVEAMDAGESAMQPTFFEVLTAMAWLHFRRQSMDVVVLETGLGGRLDATNICTPLVCIITSISRDHERLLGSTLDAIAREKAGIIKPNVPVISGVPEDIPRRVILETAEVHQSPLTELNRDIQWTRCDDGHAAAIEPQKLLIDVTTPWRAHASLPVPLAGMHQAHNLALATAAVDLLNETGVSVPSETITSGLAALSWPLRVEVIAREPLVIVDAAHNVASVEALLRTIEDVSADERVLVFATSKDKNTAEMLSQLGACFDRVILTQFVNNPRAVTREKLETCANEQLAVPWMWAETPAEACAIATSTTTTQSLICATGSFFLAAEFRAVVQQRVPSPSTTSDWGFTSSAGPSLEGSSHP